MTAIDISATGMQADQMMIDVISGNLANMNTAGYKRRNVSFKDLMYMNKLLPVESGGGTDGNPRSAQIGLGTKFASVYRILEQGIPEHTGKPLDIMISGRGYFKVENSEGDVFFTRDGSFTKDVNGRIVDDSGNSLAPGMNIPVDATEVLISREGVVTAHMKGQVDPIELGRIVLVYFINEDGLIAQGNNLFSESVTSGEPIEVFPTESGGGELLQSFLESANVDPVTSMTSLLKFQRAYEMNAKAMQIASDVWKVINNAQV